MDRCRFAPSTTGLAHPGTLLAALLAWCDAQQRDAEFILRLEDLDKERCQPSYSRQMQSDLAWLGLTWDALHEQHEHAPAHAAALDRLLALGLLYPCACTRTEIRAHARRAADGGFAYANTCRHRPMPKGGWREATEPVRVRLPDDEITLIDEGGLDLTQRPSEAQGDPVVVRRDGAVAYHLAVVVDDGAAGVTRIVRGRDIAPSTATQVALQRYLGLVTPTYRHHLLLLEPRGGKLAKLHGSVGAPALRARYEAAELVGLLAHAAGLAASAAPITAQALARAFAWPHVRTRDAVVEWDGTRLCWHEADGESSRPARHE